MPPPGYLISEETLKILHLCSKHCSCWWPSTWPNGTRSSASTMMTKFINTCTSTHYYIAYMCKIFLWLHLPEVFAVLFIYYIYFISFHLFIYLFLSFIYLFIIIFFFFFFLGGVKSLMLDDTLWLHKSLSTLVQVMTCHLLIVKAFDSACNICHVDLQ